MADTENPGKWNSQFEDFVLYFRLKMVNRGVTTPIGSVVAPPQLSSVFTVWFNLAEFWDFSFSLLINTVCITCYCKTEYCCYWEWSDILELPVSHDIIHLILFLVSLVWNEILVNDGQDVFMLLQTSLGRLTVSANLYCLLTNLMLIYWLYLN